MESNTSKKVTIKDMDSLKEAISEGNYFSPHRRLSQWPLRELQKGLSFSVKIGLKKHTSFKLEKVSYQKKPFASWVGSLEENTCDDYMMSWLNDEKVSYSDLLVNEPRYRNYCVNAINYFCNTGKHKDVVEAIITHLSRVHESEFNNFSSLSWETFYPKLKKKILGVQPSGYEEDGSFKNIEINDNNRECFKMLFSDFGSYSMGINSSMHIYSKVSGAKIILYDTTQKKFSEFVQDGDSDDTIYTIVLKTKKGYSTVKVTQGRAKKTSATTKKDAKIISPEALKRRKQMMKRYQFDVPNRYHIPST